MNVCGYHKHLNNVDFKENLCMLNGCSYNKKKNMSVCGYHKKFNNYENVINEYYSDVNNMMNPCIECGTDMGYMNPRQLCGKTYCYMTD